MIFPIGDDQVHGGYTPYFSYAFITLNIGIFLIQYIVPGNLICPYGSIPSEIIAGQDWYTILTSMFMHGGWVHLIGNMLFLWVFADNIEATIGNVNFVIFYLLGGIAATAAHVFFSVQVPDAAGCIMPCSTNQVYHQGMKICQSSVPSVGASGAISAVLGAYLVMFPKSQIKVLVLILFRNFYMSALFFLGLWIVQQLISGIMSFTPSAQTEGVAWWAHIGGFAFGVVAGFVFKRQLQNRA